MSFVKTTRYSSFLFMMISFWSNSATQDIPIAVNGTFSTSEKPCQLGGQAAEYVQDLDFGIIELNESGKAEVRGLGFYLICSSETSASLNFNTPAATGHSKYYQTSSSEYGMQVAFNNEEILPGKTLEKIKLFKGPNAKTLSISLSKLLPTIPSAGNTQGEHSFTLFGTMKIDYP